MSASVCDFTFLQGVKVVDFTQFEAGPSCTEALGWLGADVVKIENPKMGDPGRRLRPGQPDTDPYYFHAFNANKKSITVNLKSPRGLELVKDMIRKADVMIENFAPGAIERLGLSYDVVKVINPSIIYAQVKGFTILGALYKRRETGEGHRLQVAMQDAMLHYMRINFATQGLTGKAAERGGSKVPGVSNAPMGLYPCAPGGPNDYVYIMTSRANPDHWDRLLKLIDRRDLIGDTRYLTPADRVAREAEVDEVISAWTRTHTKLEAMKLVGDAGIPAGAVLDTDELNKDVTFEQRGVMQTMIHPVHRPFRMPGWPVRVDGKATRITSSPMLGEHTYQVLTDWLGLTAQAVAEMKREGVI